MAAALDVIVVALLAWPRKKPISQPSDKISKIPLAALLALVCGVCLQNFTSRSGKVLV